MGLADLDAFIDARRTPTNRVHPNAGTVDSLRATIEGDCVTVGPSFGIVAQDAENSGWVTSGDVDLVGGASAIEVEVDLAEPFDIARFDGMSSSCYVFGQFGSTASVNRPFVARIQTDGDMFVYVSDESNDESLIAATTPIPDGSRVLRWEWDGPTGTFTAKTADAIGGTLTTLGSDSGGVVSSVLTGAVEALGVCSRSANGDNPFPILVERVRAWADGVLVFDLVPGDFDTAADTTVTPSTGPDLARRAGNGNAADLTLVIPAGQSMIVNPDESDSGNRVTTGQGIVTSAAAVLDGQSGTYLSSPDADALDITGDLCIVAKVALDDWTPAAINGIVSKWESTGSEKSYGLTVTSGALRLYYSADGAATSSVGSSALGFTDGTVRWVAVTVDVDNGASGFDAKFWDGGAGDSPSWSQIGSTVTTGGAISFFDSDTALHVGDIDASLPLAGSVEYAAVYDGIGDHSAPALGDLVFALDESDLARGAEGEASFPASTGQTVTVNGNVGWSVSEWEGVEPTATFDGTDDYESVPNADVSLGTGDMSVVALLQLPDWGDITDNFAIAAQWQPDGNERGWLFRISTSRTLLWNVSDSGGSSIAEGSSQLTDYDDGTRVWVRVDWDADNGSTQAETNYYLGGAFAPGEPVTAPDWTLHDTDLYAPNITRHATTADLSIGASQEGAAGNLAGRVDYLAIYDGMIDDGGTLVFERNQVDIARAAAAGVTDGQTYPSASGHTVTSNGGVTYTGEAPFVIPSGTHALLGGTFVIGNQTGAQPYALNLGDYPNEWWGITRAAASDTARTYFDDGPAAASSGFAAFDPTELLAFFASLDWDADLIRFVIIDAAGAVVTATTASIAAIDRFIPTEGLAALYTGSGLPGALGSIVFDKRTTAPYDVTAGGEVATFATSLLTAYTPTVGDRRLGTPASISKRLN